MTVDKTSGHLMASADGINDVQTDLNDARKKSPSDDIEEIIERAQDILRNMEGIFRELSVNAEVKETSDE